MIRIGHTFRDRFEACDIAAYLLAQSQGITEFEGCSRVGFGTTKWIEIRRNHLSFANQVNVCLKDSVGNRFIVIDGQKTDGIDTALKELRGRVDLSDSLSKAHGKLASFAAGPGLEDWRAAMRGIDGGFQTQPGIFSADAPDPGSALLAAALPLDLGGKVADLGAGWGFLAREILSRPKIKRLDLVEAEADALACAKINISDERARFHWADATTWKPESLLDVVVMNPPFHQGRDADPALGAAFIQAARRMLAPKGSLWLVANRHLPYDAVLSDAFLEYNEIAGTSAFRVIHATKPRFQPAKPKR